MEENKGNQSTITAPAPQATPMPLVTSTAEKESNEIGFILFLGCLIFGILEILAPSVIVFFVTPQLVSLYDTLNMKQPNVLPTYLFAGISIVVGLLTILFGFKALKNKKYVMHAAFSIFFAFIFAGFISSFLITSTITPIYSLLNTIDSEPLATQSASLDKYKDWKVYSDKNFGFAFFYPSNMTIESGDDSYITLTFPSLQQKPSAESDQPTTIKISRRTLLEGVNLRQAISDYGDYTSEQMIIGGEDGIYLPEVDQESKGSYAFAINNRMLYEFYLSGENSDSEFSDAREIFKEILSTVKFAVKNEDTSN